MWCFALYICNSFNSRPHMEVDLRLFILTSILWTFNSRPHMEVDVPLDLVRLLFWFFQLTTSHGGRRLLSIAVSNIDFLSTHDLTWRSTRKGRPMLYVGGLSTHDLTWRSTDCDMQCRFSLNLSTHDLTWRSTANFSIFSPHSPIFYHFMHKLYIIFSFMYRIFSLFPPFSFILLVRISRYFLFAPHSH